MTDLQQLCLYALEDMTFKRLVKKYFNNIGHGWVMNMIAGDVAPMEPIAKALTNKFEAHYHDRLLEAKQLKEETRRGW